MVYLSIGRFRFFKNYVLQCCGNKVRLPNNKQRLFIQSLLYKEVNKCLLCLTKTQSRQRSGEALWWKKGRLLMCSLIGGRSGHGETLGSLTISGVTYVTSWGSIFGFLWLFLIGSMGKIKEVGSIDQVLAILGYLLIGKLFSILGCRE